jgi:hypothetical protein
MASIYFISLAAYGMHPVFTVVGTFIIWVQCLGAGRNVTLTVACLLPVTTLTRNWWWITTLTNCPNFWDRLSPRVWKFLKKSSTYNNLVAMAATMVCNYNQTHGFSWCGQSPQSVFMNGCIHHYMRIASSTLQNCRISYFIFDDIASLAGSADTQNLDPVILSNICKGLRNENPYCIDLLFLA